MPTLGGVATEPEIEAAVRDLVRARAPLAGMALALDGELRLGAGGAGLDSIALVELLLACSERFAIPLPAELLDDAPAPLTVGRLVAAVRAAVSRVSRAPA
jgi:acyl carrier protein